MLPFPKCHPLSELAWLLQFNTGIDAMANTYIHRLAAWSKSYFHHQLLDAIPAYDSLLLHFNPLVSHATSLIYTSEAWLHKHIAIGLSHISTTEAELGIKIQIPVCYDAALGNDIALIAEHTHLSADVIVQLHTQGAYHVHMIGFLPGFAYMGVVDEKIVMPRKKQPVTVKAGAVGIAGRQTGIYPTASPGGWNIVGYTPLTMFDAKRKPACLLQPGQQVQFVPISLSDFKSLQTS